MGMVVLHRQERGSELPSQLLGKPRRGIVRVKVADQDSRAGTKELHQVAGGPLQEIYRGRRFQITNMR
jgi:hypothetical protein